MKNNSSSLDYTRTTESYPYPHITNNDIQSIQIISNSICYGPCPEETDIIEQHLTISVIGKVYFSEYMYGEGFGKYKLRNKKILSISPDSVNIIYKNICKYIDNCLIPYATDIGMWEMKVRLKKDISFNIKGSMSGVKLDDNTDLS